MAEIQAAATGNAGTSKAEKLRKLRELHSKRETARKLNHQEVVAEDKRKCLPANWEQKRRRLEWEEKDEQFKAECHSRSEDPQKLRMLEMGAETAEKLETHRRRKANADTGFSTFEAASSRKYQQLSRQIKPDLQAYEEERQRLGPERFYPTANTLGLTGRRDDPRAVERMAKDIEQQALKRKKYSRRRAFDEDADVDYINDQNMRFNQKLERAFGQYTAEIKQNLERGTAV